MNDEVGEDQDGFRATRGVRPWQASSILDLEGGRAIGFGEAEVERPSSTDEETMRESIGAWDFAVMIILFASSRRRLQCRLYARLGFNHDFGPR